MKKTKLTKRTVKRLDFRSGRRGAVVPQKRKTRITIWIDSSVLKWFRDAAEREGHGYQTMLNAALKTYTGKEREPLREIVRDVVREELRARRAS
jgi:uncharacterized protein (DUF4415 family)